jgi:hypothetical protein
VPRPPASRPSPSRRRRKTEPPAWVPRNAIELEAFRSWQLGQLLSRAVDVFEDAVGSAGKCFRLCSLIVVILASLTGSIVYLGSHVPLPDFASSGLEYLIAFGAGAVAAGNVVRRRLRRKEPGAGVTGPAAAAPDPDPGG